MVQELVFYFYTNIFHILSSCFNEKCFTCFHVNSRFTERVNVFKYMLSLPSRIQSRNWAETFFCAVTSLLLPFTLFLNKWSDFYLTHLFKCLLLQVISLKISKLIPIDGISRGFVSPLHPLTQPASLAKVSLEKVAEGGWPLAPRYFLIGGLYFSKLSAICKDHDHPQNSTIVMLKYSIRRGYIIIDKLEIITLSRASLTTPSVTKVCSITVASFTGWCLKTFKEILTVVIPISATIVRRV